MEPRVHLPGETSHHPRMTRDVRPQLQRRLRHHQRKPTRHEPHPAPSPTARPHHHPPPPPPDDEQAHKPRRHTSTTTYRGRRLRGSSTQRRATPHPHETPLRARTVGANMPAYSARPRQWQRQRPTGFPNGTDHPSRIPQNHRPQTGQSRTRQQNHRSRNQDPKSQILHSHWSTHERSTRTFKATGTEHPDKPGYRPKITTLDGKPSTMDRTGPDDPWTEVGRTGNGSKKDRPQ